MSDRLAAAVAELVAALREETRAEVVPAGPDRLLSIDEAASACGIGRSRLYDEIGAGRLRTVKVGRRRLVPQAAIAELIASGSTQGTAPAVDRRRGGQEVRRDRGERPTAA